MIGAGSSTHASLFLTADTLASRIAAQFQGATTVLHKASLFYLGVIAVLPNLFISLVGSGNKQSFPFGGTAVLIMVGVGLDTVNQIESQLMQRNYEGFLR